MAGCPHCHRQEGGKVAVDEVTLEMEPEGMLRGQIVEDGVLVKHGVA